MVGRYTDDRTYRATFIRCAAIAEGCVLPPAAAPFVRWCLWRMLSSAREEGIVRGGGGGGAAVSRCRGQVSDCTCDVP